MHPWKNWALLKLWCPHPRGQGGRQQQWSMAAGVSGRCLPIADAPTMRNIRSSTLLLPSAGESEEAQPPPSPRLQCQQLFAAFSITTALKQQMFHPRNTDTVRAVTFQSEQSLVLKFRPGIRLQWWHFSPFLPCHTPCTPMRKGYSWVPFSSHTTPGGAGMGMLRAGNTGFVPMLNLLTLPQTKLHPEQILASASSHPPAHPSIHPQPHLAMTRAGATLHPSVLSMGTQDPFTLKAQLHPSPGALGPQEDISPLARQQDIRLLHHQATTAHRLPTQQLCEMTTGPNVFLRN